ALHLYLLAFPTRRSSDLGAAGTAGRIAHRQRGARGAIARAGGIAGQPGKPEGRTRTDQRTTGRTDPVARPEKCSAARRARRTRRSEEQTSELQSRENLVC